jgi:hypothetical protein
VETTWGALIKDAQKASEPITEGKTRIRIIDVQAGQSSTGKLMFTIKSEIIQDGPDIKRKTTTNLTLSPENGTALAIFFQNMEAIGLDSTFFAQEPNPDQVAAAMIGRECDVIIKHETWQNVKRGKIDRWVKSGGGLIGLPTGPIAPGTVVGAAGPPLPTSNSSLPAAGPSPVVPSAVLPTSPQVGPGPVVGTGPTAPTNAPPPLPI